MTTPKGSSASLAIFLVLVGLIFLAAAGIWALRFTQGAPERVSIRRSADVTAIAGWMTLHYIARAYAVPEPVLLEAVNVDQQEARHRSLDEIARSQRRSPAQVIAIVRSAILEYRTRPATPPAVSPTLPTALPNRSAPS